MILYSPQAVPVRTIVERRFSYTSLPTASASVEWPMPDRLEDPPPPPIPASAFGGVVGELANGISEALETPIELGGLLALAVASTACLGRYSVLVAPGHFEPLALYCATALPSGTRKSPVLTIVQAPLVERERQTRQVAEQLIQTRQVAEQNRKDRLKSLQSKLTKAKGDEIAKLEAEIAAASIEPPPASKPPRLFVQDVTPEKLGAMMAENNERMGVFSDEGGFFDILAGRYANGASNLDLALQGYSGSTVRVDRKIGESISIDHALLAVGIAPQPDVLRKLAAHAEMRGKGLAARFVFALPESPLGARSCERSPLSSVLADRWSEVIGRILSATPHRDGISGKESPRPIRLSEGAYRAWRAAEKALEPRLGPDGDMGSISDWGGKRMGNVARIAGVLHVVDCAASSLDPEETPISEDLMHRVLGLMQLLDSHAKAVFGLLTGNQALEDARRVLRLCREDRRERFTAREVQRDIRGLGNRARVSAALEVLVDAGWIKRLDPPVGATGRPMYTYVVHPLARTGK